MKKKWGTLLLAALLAVTPAALAELKLDGTVQAGSVRSIAAPYSGTVGDFDVQTGDVLAAGTQVFPIAAQKVYAEFDGVVTGLFAQPGDNAATIENAYGALCYIERGVLFEAACSITGSDGDVEDKIVHPGETVYLKSTQNGNREGVGRVTRVQGETYTVEIHLVDGLRWGETVKIYRDSDHDYDSETGRGRVMRYADTAVAAQGRIAAVYAQAGETVKTGDLLFEVVDAMAAKDAPLTLTAEASGAITYMGTISGAQVYRGQLLCEIADLSTLELSAQVDEIDLASVHVGDVLTFTLDAYAGETFSGTVTQIRPIGTPRQNATYFDVRITLPAGKTLLPGMNGTVTVGE